MGYNSYYKLKIHSDNEGDIIEELQKENVNASYAMDATGNSEEGCRWYESDEDMKDFSLKHPGVLFEMHREGEDATDMVKTYYKDGKMQQCPANITYDEFDESRLV